ncbi:MAG: hypothetical protein ACRKGH_09610 [Dehalogenimonas sp.]
MTTTTQRIQSVQQIVRALENAGCPAPVLNPVKQWALDLLLDEKKLTRWNAWCNQSEMKEAAEFERETIRVRVVESVDHYKRVGTKSGKPWGRPRRSVDFNKVLEALRNNNWRCNRAAAWLSEQTGETYVPGSVWNRVNEVAAESGMTVRQYIAAAKAESCQGGGK